ncbi:hypothetical protein QR680_015470 [Steinernema hermaphroditum]|uniref:Uncharacterized protein n=1 Tax=Steinernema hermaphroditum TaxID=289476 RepID=A0AA39H9Z9_9BILA|nr:hypothetical protein QR680_015470 [Steinernema hermaphroditum]
MKASSGSSGHDNKRHRKSRRTIRVLPPKLESPKSDQILTSLKGSRKKLKSTMVEGGTLKPVTPHSSTATTTSLKSVKSVKYPQKKNGADDRGLKDNNENEPTVFEEIATPLRPATDHHGSHCNCSHSKHRASHQHLHGHEHGKPEDFVTSQTVEPQSKKESITHSDDDASKVKPLSKFLLMQAKLRARQKAKEDTLKKVDPEPKKDLQSHSDNDPSQAKTLSKFLLMQSKLRARQKAKEEALKKQTKKDELAKSPLNEITPPKVAVQKLPASPKPGLESSCPVSVQTSQSVGSSKDAKVEERVTVKQCLFSRIDNLLWLSYFYDNALLLSFHVKLGNWERLHIIGIQKCCGIIWVHNRQFGGAPKHFV